MLHFNELRVSQDNKYLIVDVSIDNLDYFDNVTLDSIVIDTHDTYVPNGPSANPVYVYNISDNYDLTYSLPEETCYTPVKVDTQSENCFTYGEKQRKNTRIVLPINSLKLGAINPMFFIYVRATGTPSPDTPCGMDESVLIGTAVPMSIIYSQTMKYINEINYSCRVPQNFLNQILRAKAVELNIKTGNYLAAIDYWKRFFLHMTAAKFNNGMIYGCTK